LRSYIIHEKVRNKFHEIASPEFSGSAISVGLIQTKSPTATAVRLFVCRDGETNINLIDINTRAAKNSIILPIS